MKTEFQYSEHSYLNQAFVLHFQLDDQQNLHPSVKDVYENGEFVGYIVDLRSPIEKLFQEPDNYTIGYGYDKNIAPDANFDFTITVRYSDKTVVYSMREEGLFEQQDNVLYY